MRVTILGGSGFVGRHLSAALRARGDEARAISLRDPSAAAKRACASDAVVNLAGEPIAQRWSPEVKRRVRESRTSLPRAFLHALRQAPTHPGAYISASAIGYYGMSETQTFTEESRPGDDFLAGICCEWEAVALGAHDLGMRVACVRTGIALGTDGGALQRLLPFFRLGLGGRIGSGRQWYSWIHIDDLVGIYLLALDGAEGALNATAPHPVRNAEFASALGKALHRPAILPAPTIALRMLLGEGAQAALGGQRVLPERTQRKGYTFGYAVLGDSLAQIFGC